MSDIRLTRREFLEEAIAVRERGVRSITMMLNAGVITKAQADEFAINGANELYALRQELETLPSEAD